jgi:cyclohexa-1,5-dienecarbonyl-CoA hydratase
MSTDAKPRPAGSAHVSYEEGGALARVVFDGGKGNVLDRPLLQSLRLALREAEATPVKAVLIEGAGDHFSFGASVDDHRPEKVRAFLADFHDLFRELLARPVVRLAVVRGQCLGGGLELALACTRIFAAPLARLGQPEIRLAVFAPVASLLLPPRVGQATAEELLVSGRTLPAEEAARIRLIDEVHEDPLAAARAWAKSHLFALSASSLRLALQAARVELAAAFEQHVGTLERLYLHSLMATPDAVEGITAFLEKRPARYEPVPALPMQGAHP